jgi:hypothetical protein
MDEDVPLHSGGCACGAIRYRATGEPKWAAHCHCRDCRKITGTALTTYAGFAVERFAFAAGTPQAYHSSPGVTRRFCGRCGTPLTFEGARWPGEVHVLVGTLDDPGAMAPAAHVYVAHQMPWLRLADGLPRFNTVPGEGGPLD